MKDKDDWHNIDISPAEIKKERAKARTLRQSQWWKATLGKGICYYCEKKFSPQELTMDHIVPIARGGKSKKGNIAPSCKKCNTEKKLSTPAELALKKMKGNTGE